MKSIAQKSKLFWLTPVALTFLLSFLVVPLLVSPQKALASETLTTSPATSCVKIVYTVASQWPGGFVGNIQIINNCPEPITVCWSLSFDFPNGQQITQAWNASFTQSGSHVTIGSCQTIPPGGSITIGFIGRWSGTNSLPTSFTFNGLPVSP